MRILFAGGGSIGHVAPCVAVWRAVQALDQDAVAHLLCSKRLEEAAFLAKEGVPFTAIPLPRLSYRFPLTMMGAGRAALRAMDEHRPDVVFVKGGSVSVPVGLAAKLRRVPIVVHESDAVAGRATNFLSKFAAVRCTGFPLEGQDVLVTGNPVRPEIGQGNREEGLRIAGLSGNRPVLLVMGGSQGAERLNEIVASRLLEILQHCDVIHLTGKGKTSAAKQPGYWSASFVQEELPHLYAASTVALSRAGAGSISELAAAGVPAILVPLPGLARDHQRANARATEQAGGCVLREQDDLPSTLVPTLSELLAHPETLAALRDGMRTLHRADAAEHLARILLDTGRPHEQATKGL